jgi:chorismate mutase
MGKLWVRGIRGAVTVSENTPDEIITATQELLRQIAYENSLEPDRIISIIFSVTSDLNAAFPAKGARVLGWEKVPLFCATEIPVPGSLARCVRVLIHAYMECHQDDVRHVYLGDAAKLRPDLSINKKNG